MIRSSSFTPMMVCPLLNVGQLDALSRRVLHGPGQLGDRRPVARRRGRHVQGEQVAERVHGEVQLGALGALVPVPARPVTALGRAAQRAASYAGIWVTP